MTLPTKLTFLRMLLTFVIMGLLFVPGVWAKSLCLLLFLLASMSDWLDGYLARRFGQITPLGVLLDPIADKVLVIGILVAFVQLRLVPAWMVLAIFLRELVITGVRLSALKRRGAIPAAREGKQKTVSQMVTIFVVLGVLLVREFLHGQPAADFLTWSRFVILSCMWVTVGLTMSSGAVFFWRNRTVL